MIRQLTLMITVLGLLVGCETRRSYDPYDEKAQTLISRLSKNPISIFPTRFGALSANSDGLLTFKGKIVQPEISANNMLIVSKYEQLKDQDVALIQIIGGSGCPALYHFVTLSKTGLVATPEFGTCSDIMKYRRKDQKITLSMPNFIAHEEFFTEEEIKNSYKVNAKYALEDGAFYANGEPVCTQ